MNHSITIEGHEVFLDEQDIEKVSRYKWKISPNRGTFYAVTAKQPRLPMHRLLLCPKQGEVVDHINGNGLDNTRKNLRVCTQSQNAKNRTISRNNKTGFKGVYWNNSTKKFEVSFTSDNKRFILRGFDCPFKAARAYDELAKKMHGEFARTNF